MDLSIIVVNWNTRDLLAGCLASVKSDQLSVNGHQSPITEVIIVDNASTDGSADMVRERYPWARLIESRDNLGFAAGNNRALSEARGEYLLLLNPDTVVTEGAITLIWKVLSGFPQAGIAGAQLLNADGSKQMSTGVFPSLWSELPLINRRLRPMRGALIVNTPNGNLAVQAVDWVSGASLMIKRQVIQAVGPLDESFWLYTEETDWCYRARAAGWDVLLVPQAQVYHLARAASRQRFVTTMLHFYQSRVRFIRKHHGDMQGEMAKRLLWLKARLWQARPDNSPLAQAYPDLSLTDIRAAYVQLQQAMSLSLDLLLSSKWR